MDNNKGQTPIFFDSNDNLWHYRKKCLSQSMQIEYLTDPTGYDTPEEAMEEYLSYSKAFKEQMQNLKDHQVSKKDFRSELTSWYHNSFLPLSSGSTVITTSYVMYHFIMPNLGKLGDRPLAEVTATDLERLIKSLSGCCETADAQTYKFLGYFFKSAAREHKIRSNPMENVTPRGFNCSQKEVPAYTEEEIRILLKYARNTNHFLEVVLMLLGLRTGEIRGLAFADFNEAERIISIRRQIVRKDEVLYSADGNVSVKRVGVEVKATKTECSNRILRVPPLVFPLLNERRNKLQTMMQTREANGKSWNHLYDSYICVSDDGNIKSDGTLSIALKKICTNGGIPIVTPHDLRHITATMMFQYGINHEIASDTILEHVSKYLGHASTNTTFDVYMDYVGKLSRIRDVSGKVADPFYYPVNGDDGGGI